MRILITSDTVGGVWTYSQELVNGLVGNGHQVTLVSFGKLPLLHQTDWMQGVAGLDYRPTEYALEWMQTAERDIEESKRYLELLIEEVRPDLLHFSQYCYGDIDVGMCTRQRADVKVDSPSAKHPIRNRSLRQELIEFRESCELRVNRRSSRHRRDGCEQPNAIS